MSSTSALWLVAPYQHPRWGYLWCFWQSVLHEHLSFKTKKDTTCLPLNIEEVPRLFDNSNVTYPALFLECRNSSVMILSGLIYLALSLPRGTRAEVPVFPGDIGGMSSLLPPSTHLAPAAAWSALLTSQMTHTSLATQRGLPLRPRTSSGPARPFPHHNYLQDTGHRMNTKYFVRCAFIL